MTVVSFREYEPIPVLEKLGHPQEHALSVAEVEALERLGHSLGFTILQHLSRQRVSPKQFVGSIQLGDRLVEFLPKIESPDKNRPPAVRQNLLQMLLVAHDLDLSHSTQADLEHTSGSWLDMLMRYFCQALSRQVRHGLVKRYRSEEDDLAVVRGRLLIEEQLTRNLVHQERLACEYDELDENHLLNQLFKWVLQRMLRLALSERTLQAARELLGVFADVDDVRPSSAAVDAYNLDRASERFGFCWQLAKAFLKGDTTDLFGGTQNSFALLFDMNLLFESYVGKVLRNTLRRHPQHVQLQDTRFHLVRNSQNNHRLFQLRPDIVLEHGGQAIAIIDTKWKRLKPEQRKVGVKSTDFYQMHAYASRYRCNSVLLLYPWDPASGNTVGERRRFEVEDTSIVIRVGELDMSDLDQVARQLLALLEDELGSVPDSHIEASGSRPYQ